MWDDLAEVLRLMRAEAIPVVPQDPMHWDVRRRGEGVLFRIRFSQRPPSPARVDAEVAALARARPVVSVGGELRQPVGVLYVTARISKSLRERARYDSAVAAVAVDQRDLVVFNRDHQKKLTSRGRLPRGRWALQRALLRTTEPRTPTTLAREAGVSQPAAWQYLVEQGLPGVERVGRGFVAGDPELVWAECLAHHAALLQHDTNGGGAYWRPRAGRSLGLLEQAAIAATELSRYRAGETVALLLPERSPEPTPLSPALVLLAAVNAPPGNSQFEPSDAADASLEIRVVQDPTLAATARSWRPSGAAGPLTVDPIVSACELQGRGEFAHVATLRHAAMSAFGAG
ncbi:hypothetical protein [Curtobacterium sp. MCLR17_058]|uniref:hypothetical protein n=1 Tax=Curtobacterium sp. MCLR17_058 TaxID=2175635 RepID=UPI000DA74A82|nr:hypothetical protein [Curtobacterium sp. MCLR17_058]WIB42667.1 hypothetical protein DEJ11_17815 [Curtobacterium sp. MCLR17_058]